jgi:NodT family efflux transporter outer membrane factor (OMF) lipoprotein
LSLTSKVVTTAINIAAIRGQLSITKKIIRTEASELAIVHHQFLIGGASQADVLQQRTSLAIARTKLPALIKQLSQLRNQLNALTGGYPNNRISSKFSLNTLHLPSRLPISLPSTLIAQRPDIRATQALLHAACARFGIAVANQLPQFTISASFGGTADSFTNIFSAATGVWSIMGGISQTLFHAGALLDKKRAAADALRQANEQYRSTVINAFENASNALRAVQIDASTFQVQEIAERNADQSYSLAKERYLVGATNYLTLLTTDRTWQKTKLSLVKDQAVRLSDTVALFQALGGGWWNRQDAGPPPKPAAALTIPIASAFQR